MSDLASFKTHLDEKLVDILRYENNFDCMKRWFSANGIAVPSSPREAVSIIGKALRAIRQGQVMGGLSDPLNKALLERIEDCNKLRRYGNLGGVGRDLWDATDLVTYATSGAPRAFEGTPVDRAILDSANRVFGALQKLAPAHPAIRSAADTCSRKGTESDDCAQAIQDLRGKVDLVALSAKGFDPDMILILTSALTQS